MTVTPLLAEESVVGGFTHRIKILHTDLTQATANTAQVIPMINVVPGTIVTKAATHLKTAFADSADAAFNDVQVTIGDGGLANRFLAAQQVNLNGTEVTTKGGTGTIFGYTEADTIDITFNSMAAKALLSLDAGELYVFLGLQELVPLT